MLYLHRDVSLCPDRLLCISSLHSFFFFQAEDGIRDYKVTGVQTCALPISRHRRARRALDAGLAARVRQSGLPAHERVVRVAARPAGQSGERAIYAAWLPRGARHPVPHGGARPPPVLGDLRAGPAPCAPDARRRGAALHAPAPHSGGSAHARVSRIGGGAVDRVLCQRTLRSARPVARRAGARAARRAPAATAWGAHRARDAARGAGGNLTGGCADALVPGGAVDGALAAV